MKQPRHLPRHPFRATSMLAAVFAWGVLFSVVFGGCGVDNEIVGGACISGYTPCPSGCCMGEGDSGRLDGATDSSRDGTTDGHRDGSADGETDGYLDGRIRDAGLDSRASDGTADTCTPPYDTTEHCGSCENSCISTDICVLADAGTYACVPLCSAPLSDCSGICVDESDDPDNCGSCGHVCPSGFCSGGKCQGITAGDVVLIGHDYLSSASTVTEAKIVSNAAFLPASNPLRILSFEEYADSKAVANVKSILAAEAAATGRKIIYTVSVAGSDIPAKLNVTSFDELIVYDQESAAPGVLGPLGASWAGTLSTFTSAGGVVLSLDGAAGTTQEMPVFNTDAGLFAVSGHTTIPKNTPLDVIAPGDVVGHGVVTPYAAELDSVFFATSVPNGGNVTYVVVDSGDAGTNPVVVHIVP
jgi:hypothetical protein